MDLITALVVSLSYVILAIWLRIVHIKRHLRLPDGKVSKTCIISNVVLLLMQLCIIIYLVVTAGGLRDIYVEDILTLFLFIFTCGFWDKLRGIIIVTMIMSGMLICEFIDFRIIPFYLIIFNIFAYWHWLLKRNAELDNAITAKSKNTNETQETNNTDKSNINMNLSLFVSFIGVLLTAIFAIYHWGKEAYVVSFLMIIMPLVAKLGNVFGFFLKTIADILLSLLVASIVAFPIALLVTEIVNPPGMASLGLFLGLAFIIIPAIIMIGKVVYMINGYIKKKRQLNDMQNKSEN